MLNPQQMAAVYHVEGPLLVLAGAGSGKTRVITQKIAYLIEQCGYAAKHIYAVTFTNKAANEMRERVALGLASQLRRGLKVSTFHRLGLSILKKYPVLCGLRPGFSIFDSEDSLQLLRNFIPPARVHEREYVYGIAQHISRWKNDLLSPESVFALSLDAPFANEAALIYPQFQQALLAYNAVDFDDLIRLPVLLLREHQAVRERMQAQVRYMLVDEYQDANTSQYLLVKLLVGDRGLFTVVGDDDQSIYAWRGARPENLGQLQHDYPLLKVIKLEQNYRSTGRILHAANQLIANNPHLFSKNLWSEHGAGDLLRVVMCRDEQDEAEQVVADIISHHLRQGNPLGDYAILYRGNHQSRLFENVLRAQSIAYRISGGQSWFAKTEIKDCLAYLKLLCNEADDAAFLRVINTPKRGVGDTSIDALGNYAKSRQMSLYACCSHLALKEHLAEKPRAVLLEFKHWFETLKGRLISEAIPKVLSEMLVDSGLEAHVYEQCDTPAKAQKRMENITDLLVWIERLLVKDPESTLADVINKLILIDILDQSDEHDTDALQLMTLHAAKGLEFPHVYLVGLEEAILPHHASIEANQIEEERRLAYVGITRAQRSLCMTLARQRRRGGEVSDCEPSRFLAELPQDSLEWYGKGERNDARERQTAASHLAGLKALLEK